MGIKIPILRKNNSFFINKNVNIEHEKNDCDIGIFMTLSAGELP